MSNVVTIRELRATEAGSRGESPPSEKLVPIVTILARADRVDQTLRDLALRIRTLLGDGERGAEANGRERDVIEVGELVVDRGAQRARVDGDDVLLTRLEFRLLLTLVERRERAQTRGTLLSDVWGASERVHTRTLDTHVKRLRDKLGSAGRFIHTVRGVGYLFTEAPVRDTHRLAPSFPSAATGRP